MNRFAIFGFLTVAFGLAGGVSAVAGRGNITLIMLWLLLWSLWSLVTQLEQWLRRRSLSDRGQSLEELLLSGAPPDGYVARVSNDDITGSIGDAPAQAPAIAGAKRRDP